MAAKNNENVGWVNHYETWEGHCKMTEEEMLIAGLVAGIAFGM